MGDGYHPRRRAAWKGLPSHALDPRPLAEERNRHLVDLAERPPVRLPRDLATIRDSEPPPERRPVGDQSTAEALRRRSRRARSRGANRAAGAETGGGDPRPGADGGRLALGENVPHGRMGGADRDEQRAVPAAHVHDGPTRETS